LVEQLASLDDPPPLMMIPRRQLRRMNSVVPGGSHGRLDLPHVLLHPVDAADLEIEDGAEVEISSLTGSVRGTVRIGTDIRRGAVSVPHGFGEPNVSRLTSTTDVDPLTGMVLQSGIPVTIAAV
jgi:anaerobic selenocysteine-containing dehydrogenase